MSSGDDQDEAGLQRWMRDYLTWLTTSTDGRSVRGDLDFMVPFAAGAKKWDFDQITPFRANAISDILRRGAVAWHDPKYRTLADTLGGGSTRVRLLSQWPSMLNEE